MVTFKADTHILIRKRLPLNYPLSIGSSAKDIIVNNNMVMTMDDAIATTLLLLLTIIIIVTLYPIGYVIYALYVM
jgi:hypothetical protein